MFDPMAAAGALVALGGWLAGFGLPRPDLCVAGAAALALIALVGRSHRPAPLALMAGALCVGLALGAPAAPAPLAAELRVVGTVRATQGRQAWVDSDVGPLALDLPDRAPPPGTRLAAWTAASAPRPLLPGAFAFDGAARAAGRMRRRVRQWVPLGPQPPTPDPTPYASARHGGLLFALATGDRGRVSAATLGLLTRTGTRHLLAISGLHVGMVAGAAWAAGRLLVAPLSFAPVPRLARAGPALAAVAAAALYAHAVGWPTSARRAACMVAAAALARLLDRDPRPWSLLGLAAFTVVLIEPAAVRTAGFLLSFGAVVGLLLVPQRLTRWLPPDLPRPVRWAAASLAATLGAQLGTLPLSAWVFQELAPLSPLANLVAAPLLGGVSVPAALLVRHLPPALSGAPLWVADAAATVALGALGLLDRAPWTPAVGPLGALTLAAALVLRKHPLVAAGLAALALAGPALAPPPPHLVVTFLAVGQGDAALVELPDGRRWLVDGGPPSDRVLHYLRRRGIRRLDAVALSHPHPDHMGGLQPVLEGLDVGALWVTRPPEVDELGYRALWQAAFARGVPIRGPRDGPGPGVEIVHPIDGYVGRGRRRVNDESLALRFAHGQRSVLFTGDIEGHAEAWLAARVAPADVVKVPHHGSRSSSSTAFARAVSPALAVISCGPGNRFGHPHPAGLSGWSGAAWLRTDRHGTIEIRTDGRGLWARAWRPARGWRGLSPRRWTPQAPPSRTR